MPPGFPARRAATEEVTVDTGIFSLAMMAAADPAPTTTHIAVQDAVAEFGRGKAIALTIRWQPSLHPSTGRRPDGRYP
jgi:hypothetical protein